MFGGGDANYLSHVIFGALVSARVEMTHGAWMFHLKNSKHHKSLADKNKTLDLRSTKEVLLDCQSVCQPPMSTDALFCAPQKQLIQTEHEKLLSQLG